MVETRHKLIKRLGEYQQDDHLHHFGKEGDTQNDSWIKQLADPVAFHQIDME